MTNTIQRRRNVLQRVAEIALSVAVAVVAASSIADLHAEPNAPGVVNVRQVTPFSLDNQDYFANNTAPILPSRLEMGTAAGPLPFLPPRDPDEFRDIYGYRGPYFNADRVSNNVVVLSQTLFQWPTPVWKASGLIRNQTGRDVRAVILTAHLFDSRGSHLSAVVAWLPLDQLRPGEPAPFVVTTTIQESSVSSVNWSIDYVYADPANRSFELVPFWQRSFGDRQRYSGYPLTDPANPPYPYVVFGSLRNRSNLTVQDARLLGAWLDNQGRVVYVDWFAFIPATDLTRQQQSITLTPNGAEDYIFANADPATAERLTTSSLALWGISQ